MPMIGFSIQVHPDDNLAAKRNIGKGKTEMWFTLGADKNTQLISGFNREMDKDKISTTSK